MGKRCYILPDFIIIGANKAGTTSISKYLKAHEEIKMSDIKEPMFFSSIGKTSSVARKDSTLGNTYTALTIDEYSALFENYGEKVRLFGEASTAYLANPAISAPMIRSIVPEAKLIAVLREPADRAISAYKMTYGSGVEQRSFTQIIDDFLQNNPKRQIHKRHGVRHYIENGFYFQLLQPFMEYIDREQILILKYDDLVTNPHSFMSRIFNFLEIEPPQNTDFSIRYNTAERHLKGTDITVKDVDMHRLYKIYKDEMKRLSEITDTGEWLQRYEKGNA